ncbi:MAG: hypothetical protein F7C07_08165 [Desulfurococcales archaeon]|nr:hypothetical protein [Desulfurococcales archaeon]
MAATIMFAWYSGYITARVVAEGLELRGSNFSLRLGPREVSIRGPFESLREVELGRLEPGKVVYVDFAFTLKGFKEKRSGDTVDRNTDSSLGPYGVSYTRLKGASLDVFYLVVYAPAGSLYEHAVLSGDRLALFTIRRRKVYMMAEEGFRRIYLV